MWADNHNEYFTYDVARLPICQPSNPRHSRLTKKNVVREFDNYFGDVSKLANWQRFCKDIGLDIDELTSLSKCKKVRNSFAYVLWLSQNELILFITGIKRSLD